MIRTPTPIQKSMRIMEKLQKASHSTTYLLMAVGVCPTCHGDTKQVLAELRELTKNENSKSPTPRTLTIVQAGHTIWKPLKALYEANPKRPRLREARFAIYHNGTWYSSPSQIINHEIRKID